MPYQDGNRVRWSEDAQAGDTGPAIAIDFVLVLRINEISHNHLARRHDFCLDPWRNGSNGYGIVGSEDRIRGALSFYLAKISRFALLVQTSPGRTACFPYTTFLMNTYWSSEMRLFVIGSFLFLLSPLAYAGDPINDLAAFDGKVTGCLSKFTSTARCTEQILGKHIVPGSEAQLAPVASQLDDFIAKWLGGDGVYKVHPITSRKAGDLFLEKTYLIEDDKGNLMAYSYALLKRLDKWYVFSFSIDSNGDAIEKILRGK
jgi:hypothetical protein